MFILKAKAAFSKNSKSKDGLQAFCKECSNANSKKSRQENPDYMKHYIEKNRDKWNAYYRKYNQDEKHKMANTMRTRL